MLYRNVFTGFRRCSTAFHRDLIKRFQSSVIPSVKSSEGVLQKIRNVILDDDVGRLFAVIHFGSKQYKVTAEDVIIIQDQFLPDIGDRLKLEKVLMVGGKDFTFVGRPLLDPSLVRVEATVIEKTLSHNKVQCNYTKRKRNWYMKVEQNFQSMLLINSIQLMPKMGDNESNTGS